MPTRGARLAGEPAGPALTDGAAGLITRVEELAYDLRIADVMTTSPRVATPDMPMAAVLETLRQQRISGMPVVAEGRLAGIVSLEDLLRAVTANDQQAPVAAYMTPAERLVSVRASDAVVRALELFDRAGIGRLPVLDEQGALAGLLTKGDITRGLLRALQSDYQVEEVRRYRASHLFEDIESNRTSLILRYDVAAGDFAHGGRASGCIKRALRRLGANPQIARRAGIAVYEAEMNLVIHTAQGGFMRVEIEPHRIQIKVVDNGPGIVDIEQALKPGFSTASHAVRELGFGAGMGLSNMQHCVDKFAIYSQPGKGTRLQMRIDLQPTEGLGEVGRT